MVKVFKQMESRGLCNKKGLSGETGCFQFLPSTWIRYQKQYLGTTTMPMTPENEEKVMIIAISEMAKTYTPYQIALIHNQGNPGKCRKGVNSKGVSYNSCAYANEFVAKYSKQISLLHV